VLRNAEVLDDGISDYRYLTQLDPDLYIDFPYPQLFIGKGITLLCGRTAIYTIDSGGAINPLSVYQLANPSTAFTITQGEYWSMIDFNAGWLLTNGAVVIWVSGIDVLEGKTSKAYGQNAIKFLAGAEFNGRALLGGFTSSSAFKDSWKELFTTNNKDGLARSLTMPENMLWWSTIGGDDIFWWMMPQLYTRGILNDKRAHTNDKPLIFDYLERNECGYMQMSWQGSIKAIRPLGKGCLVAGTGGISFVYPVADGLSFGETVVTPVGISHAGAINGNRQKQMFVGNDGHLYAINSSLELQNLGYEEFLTDWKNYPLSINYDSSYDRFFLCNGDIQYVYNKGLSEVGQLVTGLGNVNGTLKAVATDFTTLTAGQLLYLETNPIDMGYRNLKTIQSVQFNTVLSSTEDFYVAIKYRTRKSSTWKSTDFRVVNAEGIVHIPTTGLEFKICIKCSNFLNAVVPDYAFIYWAATDSRGRRGPNVSTFNSRTGQ